MNLKAHPLVRGYLVDFSIKKNFDRLDVAEFDVRIVLSADLDAHVGTSLHVSGARNIRYGDGREGINLGGYLSLAIEDVSGDAMEGIRYRIRNIEGGCPLSLYGRSVDIEDVDGASAAPIKQLS